MITWLKGSIGTCASITELNVVISGMSTFQNRWWKAQTSRYSGILPSIVVVEKTSRTCHIIGHIIWSQNPLEAEKGYHYTSCYRSIGDLYRQTGKIPRGYPCWASDPHNAEDHAVGLSLDPETSFGLLRLLVAACARTSSMILLWFGTHNNNDISSIIYIIITRAVIRGCNLWQLLRLSPVNVTGDDCCRMNIHGAKQIEIYFKTFTF